MASIADELHKAFYHDHEVEDMQSQKRSRVDDTVITSSTPIAIASDSTSFSKTSNKSSPSTILLSRGISVGCFDPESYVFTRVTDTKRDRSYHETVCLDDKVVVISTFSVIAAGTVEVYCRRTEKWTAANSLPQKLRSIAAVTLGDDIFVIGGINVDGMIRSDKVYKFRKTSTGFSDWEETSFSLSGPRYRHGGVLLPDGRIMICGGIIKPQDSADEVFTSTSEIFDPISGVWSPGPSMTKCRAIDVNLIVIGDALYAVGGDVMEPGPDTSYPVGSIEKLDFASNTWQFVSQFPTPRRGIAAASAGSKIFVFGGSGQAEHDVDTWDAFDLNTSTWLSADGVTRTVPFDMLNGSACYLPAITDIPMVAVAAAAGEGREL